MEAELSDILHFLSLHSPFSELPHETLEHVAHHIEIGYYRSQTPIINAGDEIHELFLVRSGVVEVYRRNGELYNRLDEGALFGQMGLLTNNRVRFPVTAIKDCLDTPFLKRYFSSCMNSTIASLTLWKWNKPHGFAKQ